MSRSLLKSKGRREKGSFILLPKDLLESVEYASLTAFEAKLLIDLFVQYNGRNNGDFHCAWSLMKKRGWHSQDTLNRALCGLMEKGFATKTRQGGKHRCSLYAVTWKEINDCDGKLDVRPTQTAPGTWRKNKTVLRLAEHIATAPVAIRRAVNAN